MKRRPNIHRIFSEGTLVDRALVTGVRDALRRYVQLGESAVECRDGKVVLVPPEELARILKMPLPTRRKRAPLARSRRRPGKR